MERRGIPEIMAYCCVVVMTGAFAIVQMLKTGSVSNELLVLFASISTVTVARATKSAADRSFPRPPPEDKAGPSEQ